MKKINLITSILAVILLSTTLISADPGDEFGCFGGMGGMMTGTYGTGGMFFGWAFSTLVLVALVLLIVWLIKQLQKK